MTQKEAIKCMMSGANVFLTGAPGAGKTYTLNKFIEKAEAAGRNIAITASTGIAASHLNGTTIHSWSGLGIAEKLTEADLVKHSYNARLVKRYKRTDVLIIDEISMLHGSRLDMVNEMAKRLRNKDRPFGGMQVILVGDLYQLPPVTRDSSEFDFAHYSQAWREAGLRICYITEQHRQKGGDTLLELLQAMRENKVSDAHVELLRSRIVQNADDTITQLYSHNVDVDTINNNYLKALPGKPKKFKMRDSGDIYKVQQLKRNVLAPENLELKVGAEVMFVANNFSVGFVNGSRGRVVNFVNGEPLVKMTDGREVLVEPHRWSIKEDDVVIAYVDQFPLRLAWAITIHKSQGMSLDAAKIDLSKAFTPSMGYVALSRVRSIEGLYLTGINQTALLMHEEIYDLDAVLLSASENYQGVS